MAHQTRTNTDQGLNGASDFGNKLVNLNLRFCATFEHKESSKSTGYDKVIMLAGGVELAVPSVTV